MLRWFRNYSSITKSLKLNGVKLLLQDKKTWKNERIYDKKLEEHHSWDTRGDFRLFIG